MLPPRLGWLSDSTAFEHRPPHLTRAGRRGCGLGAQGHDCDGVNEAEKLNEEAGHFSVLDGGGL